MINKFTASCSKCRGRVDPGTGQTNKVGVKWITTHNQCPARPVPIVYRSRYHDDEDDPLYDITSSEFNPNEGDK